MTNIPASDRDTTSVDNRPPLVTVDQLEADHSHFMADAATFATRARALPTTIDDDKTSGEWQDFVKDVDAVIKHVERTRVDEKAPVLAAQRTIDGYFAAIDKAMADIIRPVSAALTSYLQRKAAAERARREEEARKKREEEQRQREEAEEAARRAQALENQKRRDAASDKRKEASEANYRADDAAAEAARATKDAKAKPADMARTRSDAGSLGTLAERWDFEIDDYMALPTKELWPHISQDAKEKAVRAFVKGGGRQLKGARIFQTTKLQVR